MKKIFFLEILFTLCFFGTAFAETSITTPKNNLVVPTGYPLVLEATGSGGDVIKLFDNNELIYDAAGGELSYIFTLGIDEGVHVFHSECGGTSSQEVTVTSINMEEYVLSDDNFDNADFSYVLDGAQTGAEGEIVNAEKANVRLPETNFTLTHNRFSRVAAVAAPVDNYGNGDGKALMIEKNELTSGGTGSLTLSYSGPSYHPTTNGYILAPGQIVEFGFDMYVNKKADKSAGNFKLGTYLCCSATTLSGSIDTCSFANTGKLSTSGTNGDFSWEAEKWHKIKTYIDFDGKIMDLYVDGERIMQQNAISINDLFDSKGVASLKLTISPNSDQTIYFDNIKMSVMTVPPRITSLSFINSDGSTATDGIPYDISAIKLKASTVSDVATLYQHIKLLWLDGDEEREVPLEFSEASGYVNDYTVALPINLRENGKYKLIIDEGFSDNDGNVNYNQQKLLFSVNPPTTYVKNLTYRADGATVDFVCGSDDGMTIKVVKVAYDDSAVTKMSFENVEVHLGENIINVSLPDTEKTRVYIWNQQFIPFYIGKAQAE